MTVMHLDSMADGGSWVIWNAWPEVLAGLGFPKSVRPFL